MPESPLCSQDNSARICDKNCPLTFLKNLISSLLRKQAFLDSGQFRAHMRQELSRWQASVLPVQADLRYGLKPGYGVRFFHTIQKPTASNPAPAR